MKIKENKGSISIYVIVTFIFLTIILISMIASSKNAEIIALKAQGVIKNIYEEDINNADEIYSKVIEENSEPEDAEYTYYFEKPNTWLTETPCAHMWNDDTGITTDWPGIPMKNEGNNIYSITVDSSIGYTNLMFTNGRVNTSSDTGINVKTQHIDLKKSNGYIFRPNVSSTKTVYFEDWYEWSNIHAYAWNGSNINKDWPGVEANYVGKIREGTDTERNLYSYEIGSTYNMLIFNNGGYGQETKSLDMSDADGAIWGVFNGSNAWHWELFGIWEKY